MYLAGIFFWKSAEAD